MDNCLGARKKGPLSPALDHSRGLILVVGNDTDCKSRVARALAEARCATGHEDTKAGTRIFMKNGSAVVMDTVPLRTVRNWGLVDTARVWISQNSLRKLFGKFVYVVCVIDSSDPEDDIHGEPDFECNRFNWLHLLKCIFEDHKKQILILVNSESDRSNKASRQLQLRELLKRDRVSSDEACRKLQLREVLKRNGFTMRDEITFVSLRRGHLSTGTIKSILLHNVYMGKADEDTSIGKTSGEVMPAPFFLQEVPPDAKDKDRFGPWGPEYMIVFGRTGSGKSTLAQMLTLGRLDADSGKFNASDGIRGETRRVDHGQGRGWHVVDTPGLGEPNGDPKRAVSTRKARRLIEKYVMYIQGTYCHFIYVCQKGRLDKMDMELWALFKEMFGAEMIRNHMTIVVSDADQQWLDDNINHLEKYFVGCRSFLPAEFPPINLDKELENELKEVRQDSLKALEEELASFCRLDASCRLGRWSVGTQRSLSVRGADEPLTMRPSIRTNPILGPSAAESHPSDYELGRVLQRLSMGSSSARTPEQRLDVAGAKEDCEQKENSSQFQPKMESAPNMSLVGSPPPKSSSSPSGCLVTQVLPGSSSSPLGLVVLPEEPGKISGSIRATNCRGLVGYIWPWTTWGAKSKDKKGRKDSLG